MPDVIDRNIDGLFSSKLMYGMERALHEVRHALRRLRRSPGFTLVAIASLGTARRLVIKPRRKQDRGRQELSLGHGALLVMGGTCQRHYVHGVPRQAGVHGERISLTFRYLLREP